MATRWPPVAVLLSVPVGMVKSRRRLAAAVRDEHAASPLVVLATAIAIAVVVTAVVLLVFVNEPEQALDLQARDGPEGSWLEVTAVAGGLQWEQLTLQLIDRGGYVHPWLVVPQGPVEEGQRISFEQTPPPGQYLVVVEAGDQELERLVLSF